MPAHGGNTPPNGAPVDAMFFENYGTNPFVSTEDDHLSTFAIDVDNGSYTMSRSYLNAGNLPPKDAVRVEEFINNFNYHYNHPTEEAFTVSVEGAPSKFGKEYYKLLKIGIAGKKIDPGQRRDANLLFVVDVSGSMEGGNRLGSVRKSLRLLLDQLTPRDRVGIVAYGGSAFKVLDPTSVTEREKIINAIEQLYPSGSTNAEAGIRLGYQMLDQIFDPGKINRIILCSDGVANVGQTAAEDLLRDIKAYADKGITLSAIGFGMGNYNDVFMEKLGNKGNGSYAYVDSWSEARRVFEENLTGMLQVIARDVKIQVDFDPDVVDRYRLLGYENRNVADDKFRDDKEDGGEIGSGHMVTALYEVRLRDGASGDIGKVYIRYKDPQSFEVTEISRNIGQSVVASAFHKTSTDFRLAAASAEFAEIMRESYWAEGSDLADVLSVLRTIENEDSNEQIIELMNLVAQADKLIESKEKLDTQEPFGMNE
jgi:Ca-activated chloride channel family protein